MGDVHHCSLRNDLYCVEWDVKLYYRPTVPIPLRLMIALRYDGVSLGAISPGNGTIWLDDVACRGKETEIALCPHSAWEPDTCTHADDVSLRCGEPVAGIIYLFIYLFILFMLGCGDLLQKKNNFALKICNSEQVLVLLSYITA